MKAILTVTLLLLSSFAMADTIHDFECVNAKHQRVSVTYIQSSSNKPSPLKKDALDVVHFAVDNASQVEKESRYRGYVMSSLDRPSQTQKYSFTRNEKIIFQLSGSTALLTRRVYNQKARVWSAGAYEELLCQSN